MFSPSDARLLTPPIRQDDTPSTFGSNKRFQFNNTKSNTAAKPNASYNVFQQPDDAIRRREERFAREHQLEIARQNGLATNGSATQWHPNSLARRLGAGVHSKKPWAVSEPVPVHDPVSHGSFHDDKPGNNSSSRSSGSRPNSSFLNSVLITLLKCPNRMLLIGTDTLSLGARQRFSRITSV